MVRFISDKTTISSIDNIKGFEQRKAAIHELFLVAKEVYGGCIALDCEFSDLDALIVKSRFKRVLLVAIGNPLDQIVIDTSSVDLKALLPDDYQDYTYCNHNIKIDYQMLYVVEGIRLRKFYDTMLADQKIFQNSGFRWSLDEVGYRHLQFYPKSYGKDFSQRFIGVHADKYVAQEDEVLYAAADIESILTIRDKQMVYLERYKLKWFVENVEFPCLAVIADMELRGIAIDQKKWIDNVRQNEEKLHKVQIFLDKEVLRLRDTLLDADGRLELVGGKYTQPRNFQSMAPQVDLFGGVTFPTTKKSKANTNYSSPQQVAAIFAKLLEPMPTKKGPALVPFYENVEKRTVSKFANMPDTVKIVRQLSKTQGMDAKGKIVSHRGFTTDNKHLAAYIIEHPDSPMIPFMENLITHGQLTKQLDTYGFSFVAKLHPVTGNIHTRFKQAFTANGRLSSGGGKQEQDKPNLQNIPRGDTLRNCFLGSYDGKWSIQTIDLTGAEVVIICDKAHDMQLYEWAVKQDDAHSPIITNSWRYIYLFRAGLAHKRIVDGELKPVWSNYYEFVKKADYYAIHGFNTDNPVVQENWRLFKSFTVNKKTNKPYRQAGKNCTFGSIYGMKPKKAAETYNGTTIELRRDDPNAKPVQVTVEEGKVALWAIRNMIPKSFDYVESNIDKAFAQGHLVLNERSNSRVWFSDVVKILKACAMTIEELKNDHGIVAQIATIKNGVYTLTSNDEFALDDTTVNDVDGQARNLPISGTQADMVKEAMVVIDQLIEKYQLPHELLLQVHDELVYRIPNDKLDITLPTFDDKETGIKCVNMHISDFAPTVMGTVATRYLKHVRMTAEATIKPFWSK